MRVPFCNSLVTAAEQQEMIFLTGDLGFKALEPLRDRLGERFINVGVAEQNMIALAAGLAKSGLRPWAYSIAPFIYARPFEQIRNDVCLHNLPVVLVGNGGGYGYGVMGATHHALEDYGTLLTLQHLRVYIPAFDQDVQPIIKTLQQVDHPAYLRLGLAEAPADFSPPPYAAWRRVMAGNTPATILVTGPLVGGIIRAARELSADRRPTIWLLSELPIVEPPAEFIADVKRSDHLVVVEEHVPQGGIGGMIARALLSMRSAPRRFTHLAARGYPSGMYGSQTFHRKESGLDPAAILAAAAGD